MSDPRPMANAVPRALGDGEVREFEARLREARGLAARARVLRELGDRLAAIERP